MGSRTTEVLSPDYYYRSIQDIDLDELKGRGIDTLLLDLDNTLMPRNSPVVTPEALAWVTAARDAGMRLCIVSNNFHNRLVHIARELGTPLVGKAMKPAPSAFARALELVESPRERVAIIGDQMFTDILGGRLYGIVTILVTPLTRSDLPHTVVLRLFERLLLADRRPLP